MTIPSKLSLPNRIKLRFGSVFMRVIFRKFAKGARLQPQIDALHAFSAKRLPPNVNAAMERDVAALREAGSLAGACGVGETFPNFELRDQKGRSVSLDDMLKSGYAVLAFVRGGWCPYCNLELRALHNRLKEIESLGATLAAVSPEVPDREVSFANLSPVAFPVLYDENNRLAKRLRITWQFGEDLKTINGHYGMDIAYQNQDDSMVLPIPAVYVVGRDRRILYAYLKADYMTRLEPQALIDALTALNKPAPAPRLAAASG